MRKRLIIVALVFLTTGYSWAQQQTESAITSVRVIDSTSRVELFVDERVEADSVLGVIEDALTSLTRSGYLDARLDSIQRSDDLGATAFVSKGSQAVVETIEVRGLERSDARDVENMITTRVGDPFRIEVLENDLRDTNDYFVSKGFLRSTVYLDDVIVRRDSSSTNVNVSLRVDRGSRVIIDRITLPDGVKLRPRFAARFLGIKLGSPLRSFDANQIAEAMTRLPYIKSSRAPTVISDGAGNSLFLPISEGPPGSFDILLGYLSGAGAGGSVVGTGRLELQNLFGGGRELSIRLDRTPNQASRVDVKISDPFVAGLPIGLSVQFAGAQRDSTFARQDYGAAISYNLGRFVEAIVSSSRQSSRPGQAGLRLVSGSQRIPKSAGFLLGGGLRYNGLDRPFNPTSGIALETKFLTGRSTESRLQVLDQDTTRVEKSLRKEQLLLSGRGFLSASTKNVIAAGVDLSVLRKDEYSSSDFQRLGGAASLRGYNEDQFEGRAVGRAFLELRRILDRTSNVFIFFDLGFVENPITEAANFHPGYGFGTEYDTPLGIMKVSYAINPDDGMLSGKVHVGLSFGL